MNAEAMAERDLLLPMLQALPLADGEAIKVLEVGCSSGWRLEKLRDTRGWSVYGVDPSQSAITKAMSRGINAQVGTAEKLAYPNNSFDLIIFGFCLYIADREDLFSIASEANRVLKDDSWVGILDFWSAKHRSVNYAHHPDVKTHKFDNTQIFSWHPFYSVMDNVVRDHNSGGYTDDAEMLISASILRKDGLT